MSRTRRALLIVLAAVAGVVVILVGPRLAGDLAERSALARFYEQPANAAEGAAGTLVRSEPLQGLPFEADAWRIMYRTTDVTGGIVIATGTVAYLALPA